MPDLSGTMRKCRIGTAKNFTLLLLLYITQPKASRRNHRAETADSWAIADRSKRECMAPVLDILPERAERNKDFEGDDLLPWSEK